MKSPAPRLARASIPFGADATDVCAKLEGYKVRLRDGRYSFTDSPNNLRIIRAHWPNIQIELPQDMSRNQSIPDIPIGQYSTRIDPKPMDHQQQAFLLARDRDFFGLFMEQGTGKTRVAIDLIGEFFAKGEITGAIVITFKGVHAQWDITQLPTHIGNIDGERIKYVSKVWDKSKIPVWNEPLNNCVLEIFEVTFSCLSTSKGRSAIDAFMLRHRGKLYAICDESHAIKTYDSIRTIECLRIAGLARKRLIMTGTPLPAKIEDEWSQSVFMSEEIFGMRYVVSFRSVYTDRDGNPRNIEQFKSLIGPHTFRVTKDECLDLPPKIYSQFFFDLKPNARKAYNELKRNFLTTVNGDTFTVQNAAVALLRLQQITRGVIVGEEDGQQIEIGTEALDALASLLDQYEEENKICIWAKFRRDIDGICEMLKKRSNKGVAKLYGGMKQSDADAAKHNFMNNKSYGFFVANAASGGTGLNLQGECRTVIYYSNGFNSVERWQSEDRFHRIGTVHPVTYIDMIANKTMDTYLLANLKSKKDFADMMLSKPPSEDEVIIEITKALQDE